MKYETDLALERLAASENANKLMAQDALIQRQYRTFTMIGLAVAAIIILIMFYVVRRLSYSQRRLTNQQEIIEQQNRTLSEALEQKESLLQEVHHRVKNNLQFIQALVEMELGRNPGADSRKNADAISRRISAIAMVHERLYEQHEMGRILIDEYIHELCESLKQLSDAPEKLVVNQSVDAIKMDISRGISLGMIINELLTNSIKYAFDGVVHPEVQIEVKLNQATGKITMHYRDNGVGFDPEEVNKGLGLRLIDMFSRQLKGQCSFK
ncbi:MAG: hypothetical protein Kow0075_14030 [Salibacteraceae bacterium]